MVYTHSFSLWVLWVHISMLCIDSVFIWGLYKKMKWAYFLTLALFIQQTVFQAFFRVKFCLGFMELDSNALNVATIFIGSSMVLLMVTNHKVFIK